MTDLDSCQDFYASSEDETMPTAVDDRYDNVCLADPLPDEWEAQSYSGVQLTLESMPSYSTYLPQPYQVKSKLYFKLWARTTLDYKVDCDHSINDAYNVLVRM